jgi:hypothetical protein
VQVEGELPPPDDDAQPVPVRFRLPCPPAWDDARTGAWAAERRARRAYLAALDALHTGRLGPDQVPRLVALLRDLRSTTARPPLEHLVRVLGRVRRCRPGERLVRRPPQPLTRITVTVPVPPAADAPWDDAALVQRYRWTLGWLRDRGFVVARDLVIEWHLAGTWPTSPPPPGADPSPGQPSDRRDGRAA